MKIQLLQVLIQEISRYSTGREMPFRTKKDSLVREQENMFAHWRALRDKKFKKTADYYEFLSKKSKSSSITLRSDKVRFTERLLSTFLFIALPKKENPALHARQVIYRRLAIGKILEALGLRKVAIVVLEDVVEKAEKYHVTEVAMSAAKTLRFGYNLLNNREQYEYWKKRHQGLLEKYIAEVQAEEYALEFQYRIATESFNVLTAQQQGDIAQRQKVWKWVERFQSHTLYLFAYRLTIMQASARNDQEVVLEMCGKARKYCLKHRATLSPNVALEFGMREATILQRNKATEQVVEVYHSLANTLQKSDDNYFTVQYNYCLSLLHIGNYTQAYSVLVGIQQLPEFERVNVRVRELWQINEKHIHYLHASGRFVPNDDMPTELKNSLPTTLNKPDKKFLQRLASEMMYADKDKQGVNQTLIVFEILNILSYVRQEVDGDDIDVVYDTLDLILNKMQSLPLYRSRYLQGPENRRSYCMFSLILVMMRKNFHVLTILENSAEVYEEMEKLPIAGIEVIPYETAWNIILDELRILEKRLDF
jgi:hypothetical protein